MTDPDSAGSHRGRYDLLGVQVDVRSNRPEVVDLLDRLNAELRSHDPAAPAELSYVARTYDGASDWEVSHGGEELRWCENALDAASFLEWHMCGRAIERRHDLLHVHGAVLAGATASVLLPGRSGIGKTTFALALALRGPRLLADDVVFLRTTDWRPEPFPRSFHIHDDALPRLVPLGLRYDERADHIGDYLCASVLGPWDRSLGPPVRSVVFPRLDPAGPLALVPLSHAEATLELMRYSKNLRHFPRSGLDLVSSLLGNVRCFELQRNDDLSAAAALLQQELPW